ncbi:hypothetical protein HZH66_013693 [Vespula vulgaris]|uniref:Uncharacterized protein n=1 Tax=Vespula vulgaris TaxID=7454 RepID=A0A834JAX4_VESVU|nr:hypothetical protein HZH66_013693 [Vespula vulgaris]
MHYQRGDDSELRNPQSNYQNHEKENSISKPSSLRTTIANKLREIVKGSKLCQNCLCATHDEATPMVSITSNNASIFAAAHCHGLLSTVLVQLRGGNLTCNFPNIEQVRHSVRVQVESLRRIRFLEEINYLELPNLHQAICSQVVDCGKLTIPSSINIQAILVLGNDIGQLTVEEA